MNNGGKISTLKKCVSFFIAFILLFTVSVKRNRAVLAASDLPVPNTAARHEICTSLSEAALAYYSGDYSYSRLSSMSGAKNLTDGYAAIQDNELYTALHTLMSETHVFYTSYSGYNKGSLAYYWKSTDAVPGSLTYIMFYSDIYGDSPSAKLNREHIWPKGRASFSTSNGGADLHHLRPSVESVNLAKSDHAFGFIKDTYADGYKSGEVDGKICYLLHTADDLFECKDDVKGDVARILLYVYCRWGQPNLFADISENLPEFDSDDTKNNGKKVIESLDTLLTWCESDPVDKWEMERNDLTEQVQGNRNVFIDYPELAFKMFGMEVPAGMTSPTRSGCVHRFLMAKRQNATADADGFFTLKCSICGNERTRKLAMRQTAGYIPGDINGDSSVNNKDLTRLFQYLSEWDVEINAEALDINGDTSINNKDLTRLFQYLSEWDVEIF